jgi:hypothetical protein
LGQNIGQEYTRETAHFAQISERIRQFPDQFFDHLKQELMASSAQISLASGGTSGLSLLARL